MRRLARRRLAEPGRQHAAHDDLVDILTCHDGTLERAFDGDRAERRGGNVLQAALKAPHRRARAVDDDNGIGTS